MTILDLFYRPSILISMDRTAVEPPSFVSRQVTEARRFYLNLNPPAGHGLTVVCGGWESCSPDFRVERADFPFFCVEFVAGGSGSLLLAGKEWPLRRGAVFSYGPGCGHRIESDAADPLEKYFLEFTTAAEVAAACHVHPAYLSRLFVLHGQEPPYHALLRRRMRHAASLLDGGDKIVREVAENLGLDPFHFSRVFKRVHGVSPAEFLKRRR